MDDNSSGYSRASEVLKEWAPWLLSLSLLLGVVFWSYPIMGHDYTLITIWNGDYYTAWNKFGQFHFDFSPQRCGGVPVWANPINSSFSLFHYLSLFFHDVTTIALFITIYSCLSYYGVRKFLRHFDTPKEWINPLSIAWCVQGYVVGHLTAGHIPFMSVGLWPLYAYLILREESSNKKAVISTALFTLLYTHEFYAANTYLFLMFPVAFLLLAAVLRINGQTWNWKLSGLKWGVGSFLTALAILPKVFAVTQFTKNFPRETAFIDVGFLNGLNYMFMTTFVPLPLQYRDLAGWWYGNWESHNYVFPFLLLAVLLVSAVRAKLNARVLVSFALLFVAGAVIASGVYSEFFKTLPVVKSLHVNPRWMPIVYLGFLGMMISFVKINQLPRWLSWAALVVSLAWPMYCYDKKYFGVTHHMGDGYDRETNHPHFCYEPVFGYRLELLPKPMGPEGKYYDPRCFLGESTCMGTYLPEEFVPQLENYSLKPFDN